MIPPTRFSRGLALLAAGAFFMESIDATILQTALPAIASELGVTAVGASVTIVAYLLVVAIALPATGWLGDRLGVRVVFLLAVAIFTIEYLTRLWVSIEHAPVASHGKVLGRLRFAMGPYLLIDLLAIAPFYLALIVPAADLRVLRVFRLLRMLKLARYSPGLNTLIRVLSEERRALGGGDEIAIGFIDHHKVGKLHDAALDALQVVAAARRQEQHEHIDHFRDCRFRLADADGLDHHHIETRRFHQQHGLTGAPGDAAQRAAGGRGADKGVRVPGEFFHSRLVAEDRPARARGGRVDGEHRDLVPLGGQLTAERFRKGRFTDAGGARQTEPDGLARLRQDLGQKSLGGFLMVAPGAFDQCNGARQRPSVALPQSGGELVGIGRAAKRRLGCVFGGHEVFNTGSFRCGPEADSVEPLTQSCIHAMFSGATLSLT